MVRDWIKAQSNIELKPLHQVLSDLWAKGHQWVIVQSMHLIRGHEFCRLVDDVRGFLLDMR